MPPLRERPDDILPLARVFLAETARRMGRKLTGFTPRAADQLLRYEWPGNVREVQNAIEHAVALAAGNRVEVEDLPEELRVAMPRPRPIGRTRPLEDVERDYILAALESAEGNRNRAAADLGIGLATLRRKLKRYGSTEARPRRPVAPAVGEPASVRRFGVVAVLVFRASPAALPRTGSPFLVHSLTPHIVTYTVTLR